MIFPIGFLEAIQISNILHNTVPLWSVRVPSPEQWVKPRDWPTRKQRSCWSFPMPKRRWVQRGRGFKIELRTGGVKLGHFLIWIMTSFYATLSMSSCINYWFRTYFEHSMIAADTEVGRSMQQVAKFLLIIHIWLYLVIIFPNICLDMLSMITKQCGHWTIWYNCAFSTFCELLKDSMVLVITFTWSLLLHSLQCSALICCCLALALTAGKIQSRDRFLFAQQQICIQWISRLTPSRWKE